MFCLALFREMRRVTDHVRPERLRLCRTPGTLMLRWPGTPSPRGIAILLSLDTLTSTGTVGGHYAAHQQQSVLQSG
jgi:hypothetical protein